MPYPPPTALFGDMDLHIKNLADAADAALAALVRVATIDPQNVVTGGDGSFWVGTPLTSVSGVLVQAANTYRVYGPVTVLPPVPPASIGRNVPATYPVVVYMGESSGGGVRLRCFTSPWDDTGTSGNPTMGSQPATGGQTIQIVGLAWGPA
jgi:hypothetical protein